MNNSCTVTVKKDLVPEEKLYLFADPKFIGESFCLFDASMYIRRTQLDANGNLPR